MDKDRIERANPSLQKKIWLGAMSLVGLLLAAGGITTAATGMEGLRGRLTLDLPGWLWIPFIVLLSVEAVFIVYLMAPGLLAGRRRQEGRKSTLTAMILILVAATAFWSAPRPNLDFDLGDLLTGVGKTTDPMSMGESAPDAPSPVHSSLTSGIMEALLLALACMGFGVMVWLFLGTRPLQGRGVPSPVAPSALQTAVEESLDDLRRLADARVAIIKCYDRFERALAGADVRRAPWETAVEFMRRALKRPELPHEAVHELTSLFELARFSHHALGPEHRERAWRALMTAKDALGRETVDGSGR